MFAGDAVFPNEVHWGTRCPMFAGDAVFPGEVHWGTDAQCLRGIPYFPMKFIGAQMPNVCRGCRIPRLSSLGYQIPNVCRGSGCHHPQTILPVGMLCTTYTQILKLGYRLRVIIVKCTIMGLLSYKLFP